MKRIYLDHNATTPLHPDVLEAMLPMLREGFGNPSCVHYWGQQARRALDRARAAVGRFIGAMPGEIVFVSGGTEADNLAICGAVCSARRNGNTAPHIITSVIEHPAVLRCCERLEQSGVSLTRVGVDEHGRVDPAEVEAAITENTCLVSIMLANNDVGTIQPVAEIARLARARGVLVHTDAVQAAGKVPVNVKALDVDLLSLSAHKLFGPKGIGALYIRRRTPFEAQTFGGGQEFRRRAGTENVAAAVGFAKACEVTANFLQDGTEARIAELRDHLQEQIVKRIPQVLVNAAEADRVPNTVNVCFDGVEGETLLMSLDLAGVGVSAGSACSSGSVNPSHVLVAMGRSDREARGAIRFSLGPDNTREDIDNVLTILVETVRRVRPNKPKTQTDSRLPAAAEVA